MRSLPFDPQLLHLLAQRIAGDAEHLGGERLVALGLAEHRLDHGLLDVLQHHLVDRGRLLAVHVLEVAFERALDTVGELVRAAHAASLSKKSFTAARCAVTVCMPLAALRSASPPGSARTAQPMC